MPCLRWLDKNAAENNLNNTKFNTTNGLNSDTEPIMRNRIIATTATRASYNNLCVGPVGVSGSGVGGGGGESKTLAISLDKSDRVKEIVAVVNKEPTSTANLKVILLNEFLMAKFSN